MKKDAVDIVFEEYQDQFTKKVAIKNDRKPEKLLEAIQAEYNQLDLGELTEEEILDRLRRAAFAYMNEPLMYKLVRKFDNLSLPEDEKVSAARIGFTIAMNNFDPTLGYQFSTFAWRIISNEIIHANGIYLRPMTYNDSDRDIYATGYGEVINITPSSNYRKVVYKGEEMELKDITVKEDRSEKIYPYIYNLTVEVGDNVSPGQILGRTAGAIIEVGSADELIDSEDIGDVQFKNVLNDKEIKTADQFVVSDAIKEVLESKIETFSEDEQRVIRERFYGDVKVPRKELAKKMGLSEYMVAKTEKKLIAELKEALEDAGFKRENIHL